MTSYSFEPNGLEKLIGSILLENPLARAGNIGSLDIEELTGAALARTVRDGATVTRRDIGNTIQSLLQQFPQSKTPEQRVQFYKQVNQLYEYAKNGNRMALVEFVESNFNRPYNVGYFFDKETVKVLAFALEYTLIMHGDGLRKIRGANGIKPLYSSHPLEVALTYIDTFDRVNQLFFDSSARREFRITYGSRPRRRPLHFADVIALLWHDLPEEEWLSPEQIIQNYLDFIRSNFAGSDKERFEGASKRILDGIHDLTIEGNYFDIAAYMLGKERKEYLMGKASDKIANLGEMDDIPGAKAKVYSSFRDWLLKKLGYDSKTAQALRRIKNYLAIVFRDPDRSIIRDMDRKISHRLNRNATFNSADRIEAMFEGFVIRDTFVWYSEETGDTDPYLIQFRDGLMRAVLERGDHLEFDLLNYHCRGFNMPLELSHNNWRLHKHVHRDGRRQLESDPKFMEQYFGAKPFDLEAKLYIDGQLEQTVADGTLFRRTEGGRGGIFDGLIDKYYSKLITAPAGEREQVMQEILRNKTLQYMLTIALIRLGERYRDDPYFKFDWGNNPRTAMPPSSYASHIRNATGS